MAQPHKGPRRSFLVRWTDEDGCRAKAQAAAAGMTVTDYLTQLVRRDELEQEGSVGSSKPAASRSVLPMSA